MPPHTARTTAYALVALLAAVLLGCGGGSAGSTYDGPFFGDIPDDGGPGTGGGGGGGGGTTAPLLRLLDSGDMSGVTSHQTWTARTQTELDALWAAHRPTGGTPPTIDFTNEIVVAVFLGQRTSSGPGVDLVAAVPDGLGAVVLWDELYPGASCPPGLPVVVHPYAIAAMTRVVGSVGYDGSTRAYSCP